MQSNSSLFDIWFILVFLINGSRSVEYLTHTDKNQSRTQLDNTNIVFEDTERIYIDNYKADIAENDPLCNISMEKRQMLCHIVFKVNFYKQIGYYMNKTAHYMERKLSCELNQIYIELIKDMKLNSFKQQMFPCYARHEIVRTSFIEDEYFNYIYLSTGPFVNSVTVYVLSKVNADLRYVVVNYIYDIDLSVLDEYIPISIKEVIQELNMLKKMFDTDVKKAEKIYINEIKENLDKSSEDPICNLEYEKKITLCTKMFDYYRSNDVLDITLNKAATYIFDMSCFIRSVHKNSGDSLQLLHAEQKMFPCFGKMEGQDSSYEHITDKYNHYFYLSSGSKRNTVFVYFYNRNYLLDINIFLVIDLLGNIDLKHLKSTFITDFELMTESKIVYSKIKKIIDNAEKHFEKELSPAMLLSYETDEQENELIQKILSKSKKELFSLI